ncbi:hypothetical protein Pla123a_46310 [Posidoniimonas polymericola]|uniref:Nickel uptake substrate-specific transmembrane region n=1 Tax=Posidoniimonas polymericola TaxID=2528002 RepID=A0A5C5XWP9_9BACT|nr:carboxypeptidase-like regulatory domain-containing protein [Posidoniimonas polymericola]TWT66743.1 hypothetical protein Pla123a_46310 [Posidoniimonas polymericola]
MSAIAKRIVATLLVFPLAAVSPIAAGAEAHSTTPAAQAPVCHDVALAKGGVLSGRVVDPNGQPVANGPVWLAATNQKPIAARTDAAGRFAFQNLPRGVFCLQAGDDLRVCRVWDEKAAPPKSLSGVLMVADGAAVRGQSSPPPMLNQFVQGAKRFFTRPIGVITLGAAIATPIVLSADNDDPPASP